ncbi:MAG: acyltransferase [Chitinophagaceae bacterium]
MAKLMNVLFVFFGEFKNKLLVEIGTLFFKIDLHSSDTFLLGKKFSSNGVTFLRLKKSSRIQIGDHLKLNNGEMFNSIGRQSRCIITVRQGAELIIGNNVGISSSAIFCSKRIVIGNNVKIGGNVCIYDTDFHALDYLSRRSRPQDILETLSKEVHIGNDVFIGAHSTILKGVTVGDRAIIGACSVITKNVLQDEIWAGNPAKCIRRNSLQNASLQ